MFLKMLKIKIVEKPCVQKRLSADDLTSSNFARVSESFVKLTRTTICEKFFNVFEVPSIRGFTMLYNETSP